MFIFFKTILHTVPFDDDGGDVGVVSYCEGGYDGADDQYGEVEMVTNPPSLRTSRSAPFSINMRAQSHLAWKLFL